jgi:hypothetical protein
MYIKFPILATLKHWKNIYNIASSNKTNNEQNPKQSNFVRELNLISMKNFAKLYHKFSTPITLHTNPP